MSDPIVHITNGIPDSGTGNITTLGAVVAALPAALGTGGGLKVDGSGTALPVSGTVTVNGTVTANGTMNIGNTPNSVAIKVDGSGVTQPVSMTSTAITGTVAVAQSGVWNDRIVGNAGAILDFAGQNAAAPANSLLVGAEFNTTPTTITSGNASPLQIDSSGNLLVNIKAGASSGAVAQGSTTSGQTGGLNQGAVTTSAPTYTNGQTSPLSLDTSGNLRVNVTNANTDGQKASSGSAPVTLASDQTFSGQNQATPTNQIAVGGQFNTTPTTITSGNVSPLQIDSAGNLLVNIKAGSSSGTVAQGSTTSGQSGNFVLGAVTTSAPSYTTAQTSPLSLDTAGNLRVNVVTGGTSGVVAQGSTTSGQTGMMVQAAVTTSAPSYTTAQTSPLSADTAGNLRTLANQGGSWSVSAVQSGNWPVRMQGNGGATMDFAGQNASAPANSLLIGGEFNTTPTTITSGNASPLQLDNAGNLLTNIKVIPALVAGTASIGTIQTGVTATANGSTASRINAANTTNATNLKASAGQLYTIDVFNVAAYNVFLKLYNKASSPTVGSDTPIMTIPIQAGGGFSKTWPMGLPFSTGISYAITKLQADSDTTVVAAGDVTGNTLWI